jgi:hypothetical protein
MSAAPFEPRLMRLSILTAALQELTPRERRDADPDLCSGPTQSAVSSAATCVFT